MLLLEACKCGGGLSFTLVSECVVLSKRRSVTPLNKKALKGCVLRKKKEGDKSSSSPVEGNIIVP